MESEPMVEPAPAPLASERLLAKLKELDGRYESGFTAAGTYIDVPERYRDLQPQKRRWKISLGNGTMAYEEVPVEILNWEDVLGPGEEPPPRYEGRGGLLMNVRTTILVKPQQYFVLQRLGLPLAEGPVAPWPEGEAGPATCGILSVYRRDDPAYLGTIERRMQLLGRGYSKYIDRITETEARDDGLISAAAEGVKYRGEYFERRLRWSFLIDPKAAFMVRSARLDVVGIEDEHEERELSGTMWDKELCVPQSVSLFDERNPHKVTSISSKPDLEFFRKCEAAMRGPFPVPTDLLDRRIERESGKPFAGKQFKVGETWAGPDRLDSSTESVALDPGEVTDKPPSIGPVFSAVIVNQSSPDGVALDLDFGTTIKTTDLKRKHVTAAKPYDVTWVSRQPGQRTLGGPEADLLPLPGAKSFDHALKMALPRWKERRTEWEMFHKVGEARYYAFATAWRHLAILKLEDFDDHQATVRWVLMKVKESPEGDLTVKAIRSLSREDDKTFEWGKPVNGVQCRLEPDKTDWKPDEVPTFKAYVRHLREGGLMLAYSQILECRLEVNGEWYEWVGGGEWTGPGEGASESFERDDGFVEVGFACDGWPELPAWRSLKGEKNLEWPPGRYVVRFGWRYLSFDGNKEASGYLVSSPATIVVTREPSPQEVAAMQNPDEGKSPEPAPAGPSTPSGARLGPVFRGVIVDWRSTDGVGLDLDYGRAITVAEMNRLEYRNRYWFDLQWRPQVGHRLVCPGRAMPLPDAQNVKQAIEQALEQWAVSRTEWKRAVKPSEARLFAVRTDWGRMAIVNLEDTDDRQASVRWRLLNVHKASDGKLSVTPIYSLRREDQDDFQWGEDIEGVQCRLVPDKTVWRADEFPTFKVWVRHLRDGGLKLAYSQILGCRLEVNGIWYEWAGPALWTGPVYGYSRLFDRNNTPLKVGFGPTGWSPPVRECWRSVEDKKWLEWPPGRYVVRFGWNAARLEEPEHRPFFLVSSPATIVVKAKTAEQAFEAVTD